MNAKEKALEHLNFYHNKGKGGLYRRMKEVIDVAINESKKEVFDDIEKDRILELESFYQRLNLYEKIKKRHLSTFAKSDIIADKQNPQS